MADMEMNYDEKLDEIVIRVKKCRFTQGFSKSGNSEIIATTHGAISLGNGIKVSVNIYKTVKR